MPLVSTLMRTYLSLKHRAVDRMILNPEDGQKKWLQWILARTNNLVYTNQFTLSVNDDYQTFAAKVPIVEYPDLMPYVMRMMKGEQNILWPGKINWFSKSSGTTASRSKYIPVSIQNLRHCHVRGFIYAMSIAYDEHNYADYFSGKCMTMGGSIRAVPDSDHAVCGDVSAIILANMPSIGKYFYAFDEDIAFLDKWDEKIERSANMLAQNKNITMVGGVPTWNIVLFNRILEITGKSNMLEVWPRVHSYIHGGVSFTPYKRVFEELFPDETFIYQEIYNASEGLFAVQDDWSSRGLLLMTDNGVFYEFVRFSDWTDGNRDAVRVQDVSIGVRYVMIITTTAGLWRYAIGDVVQFVSKDPYRILITGRTKHFINAFGEEVIQSNTDDALTKTCALLGGKVKDYTVAPYFLNEKDKGRHDWAIEFIDTPTDINIFADQLDQQLRLNNSDYDAKRSANIALEPLRIACVKPDTFNRWLKANNKFGAQNKIPRLSQDRKLFDAILRIHQSANGDST